MSTRSKTCKARITVSDGDDDDEEDNEEKDEHEDDDEDDEFSLRSCRSSSVILIFERGICWESWQGICRIFFRIQKIKAQTIRRKIRSIFREKIRALEKIFRANFVLQTCHPNDEDYEDDKDDDEGHKRVRKTPTYHLTSILAAAPFHPSLPWAHWALLSRPIMLQVHGSWQMQTRESSKP